MLLSKDEPGVYFVEHVLKMFATPGKATKAMVNIAAADGGQTTVAFHQDPASADKLEAEHTGRALDGFDVRFSPTTGNNSRIVVVGKRIADHIVADDGGVSRA